MMVASFIFFGLSALGWAFHAGASVATGFTAEGVLYASIALVIFGMMSVVAWALCSDPEPRGRS